MNAEVYLEECLKKRVWPLIKKHNVRCVFWSDLASCYYAGKVTDWLKAKKVDFLPKDMNPANVPQLRPIEKYWAKMKRKMQTNGKCASDIEEFRRQYAASSRKYDGKAVQALMRGVKGKLRKCVDQESDEQF